MIDGRLQPASIAPPLLSSASSPWSGFLLERDWCRPGHADSIVWTLDQLIYVVSGSIGVDDKSVGAKFVAAKGSVTIWPLGFESKSLTWGPEPNSGADAQMIRVQLDPMVLMRFTTNDALFARAQLVQRSGVSDLAIANLIEMMEREISAGCPSGALYGESLCLSLATRAAAAHAAQCGRPERVTGGLSRSQLGRIREHINENLGSDLSLLELAGIANLSPRHFALAFRQSTGTSPHQYVVAKRVAQGARLLASRKMSLTEIALTLGFANQSHFTQVFKKALGTTPRRYRLDF